MIAAEDDLLREAQVWHEEGRNVAIATVVETWGSAPRPTGSHLIIDQDGRFLGSVSGGCVETDVVTEAFEVIGSGRPRLLEFGVADEVAWTVGLSCGGRIKIYVERLDETWLSDLRIFNQETSARRPVALITTIGIGAQRVVRADQINTDPLSRDIGERLRVGRSGVVQCEGCDFFITVRVPPVRVVAVGAVHISQALATMARLSDFEVIVIDPRSAFATTERFPDVTVIADWPADILARLAIDPYTAICLLTHDPKIDDQALVASLRAQCFYIGALGSRKTHARRIERMRAEGFGDSDLARIHAPIGLDIGAVTPAEIAVSILGEIIEARGRKPLRSEANQAA